MAKAETLPESKQATIDRLLHLLDKVLEFGRHTNVCVLRAPHQERPCDCGWEALNEETRKLVHQLAQPPRDGGENQEH